MGLMSCATRKDVDYTLKEGANGSRNWNFSHIKEVLDVQACGASCTSLREGPNDREHFKFYFFKYITVVLDAINDE